MRKALTLLAVLVATALVGQTDGLTYQAVIIDNNPQEIPGVDITGNVLSEGEVWLRFTIINQGATEYQEVHQTTTDRYGMVSLVIGGGEMLSSSPLLFTEIDWNGTPRQLAVELAFAPDEFDAFTVEELYFVPYAYHRNITATGTLIVDGNSTLHSDLQVGGNTNIDGTLSVWGATEINNSLDVTGGNPTNLSGNVTIGGDVQVDGSSNFDGPSTFNTITVLNHSQLNGTLDVDGAADFAQNVAIGGGLSVSDVANFGDEVNIDSTLVVHDDAFVEQNFTALGSSMLRGQVTINPSWTWGEDDDYGAYALRVEGTHQGVAVSLGGTAQEGRNFMLFLDGEQNIKGGIEGQTNGDLITSWRFIFDTAMLALQTGFATAEAIACSANIPPDAGEVFVNTGLAIALGVQTGEYAAMNNLNVGVAYISGSADYAEWLERMDVNEVFKPGEVVGVYAGQISHKTEGADHLLVISTAPAVLGNMPDEGQEDLFEKVAFLGQVPVLVAGPVQEGDYIVASGNTDGYAKAYAPDDLATAPMGTVASLLTQIATSHKVLHGQHVSVCC